VSFRVGEFQYSPWRHGGWYVDNVQYPSGAVGCVSRNYPTSSGAPFCDERPADHTYRTRDDAARAERDLIAAGVLGRPKRSGSEVVVPVACPRCGSENLQQVWTADYRSRGQPTGNAGGVGYTATGGNRRATRIECAECLTVLSNLVPVQCAPARGARLPGGEPTLRS
jgi:hypothetical protein